MRRIARASGIKIIMKGVRQMRQETRAKNPLLVSDAGGLN
jgi:hypothetical protein